MSHRRPLALFHVTYTEGDALGKLLAFSSHLPLLLISFEIFLVLIILFSYSPPSTSSSPLATSINGKHQEKRKQKKHPFVLWIWPTTKKLLLWFLLQSIAGQILNEALARYLKITIQNPRPETSDRNEYGLPSSHAQFMAFKFIIMMYKLFVDVEFEEYLTPIRKYSIATLMMTQMLIVSFSRWYLGYHYSSQIFFGWLFGILFAFVWIVFIRMLTKKLWPSLHAHHI